MQKIQWIDFSYDTMINDLEKLVAFILIMTYWKTICIDLSNDIMKNDSA